MTEEKNQSLLMRLCQARMLPSRRGTASRVIGRRHRHRRACRPALTIAISREAGARGTSIGRRVGKKLGWQVYNQEILEYIAQEGIFRQEVAENLSPEATRWTDARLQALLAEQNLSQDPSMANLAHIVLALGVGGKVVIIGRGAGCILPPASTLHVRIVAPLADRVAYTSQWLRMTLDEAAEHVRLRDQRRSDFLATHFHRPPNEIYQYDLLLNSSLLGEDLCVELIAQAAPREIGFPWPPTRRIESLVMASSRNKTSWIAHQLSLLWLRPLGACIRRWPSCWVPGWGQSPDKYFLNAVLSFRDIPGCATASVTGHKGCLTLGQLGRVTLP